MVIELKRLVRSVEKLSTLKDGKPLFEHSPSTDKECFEAWAELNGAMAEAKYTLKKNGFWSEDGFGTSMSDMAVI